MNSLRTVCLERAHSEVQDCLVIGAGINGAVAAAALTGRGAKTTIIDRGDFASFTSQESSNLAWGGIKYLETYEFGLVWHLCKSRNRLMRAYPSQVQEIRFFTSIAKGFRKPRILIYLGTLLYWFMGRCQTKPPRLLSRAAIRREAPMINTKPLAGGLEYSDGHFVENDARFVFGFVRKALDHGGSAINYMELVSAEWRDSLWHCRLIDQLSGEALEIKAKSLVNAAGPFADKINRLLGIESKFKHIFSKGAHIIVPQITPTRRVLTFFATDGRLFFMIPMGDRTCIGTTDTRVDNETVEPTGDDVAFLLANANALLNLAKPLTLDDVIAERCGVRPLVVKRDAYVGNAEWSALSRKHEIDVHPERKMLSIYGGKLTDCINVGEEVADIVGSFGLPLSTSDDWFGEPGEQERVRFETECAKLGIEATRGSRLWRRYGKDAFQILEKTAGDPAMAEAVLGDYTRAELQHIAENEMVVHFDDFLRRRSQLELTVGRAALRNDRGFAKTARILFGENSGSLLAEMNRLQPTVRI